MENFKIFLFDRVTGDRKLKVCNCDNADSGDYVVVEPSGSAHRRCRYWIDSAVARDQRMRVAWQDFLHQQSLSLSI